MLVKSLPLNQAGRRQDSRPVKTSASARWADSTTTPGARPAGGLDSDGRPTDVPPGSSSQLLWLAWHRRSIGMVRFHQCPSQV